MKKLILLFLLLMVGVCAYAQTPAPVNGTACDTYSGYSCSVTVSVVAGENAIAFMNSGGGGASVVDTNGDVFTPCGATTGGSYPIQAYCGKFATTNGSEVITMTGNQHYYYNAAVEIYSGNFTVVDVATGRQGAGTAASTASVTTANAIELLVGGFLQSGYPAWTAGSGWTARQNNGDIMLEDMTTSSAGSYSATATSSVSVGWGAVLVALKYLAPSAAAPTYSPSSGIVPQTVTISCSTSGTYACYNTTNSVSTNGASACTTGAKYSSSIAVSTAETLYAVCGGGGTYSDSSIATANFGAVPIHRRVKSY